ncbi:MAG TPA: hypothetical protein DCY64_22690 [Hydrogenophaga sp.]|nr:MAG: hypothetical protein A2X73_07525 [Burkholderiales bacterium GWE1_65_30]OGA89364.1 MAG: hypothetical protein A2X72_16685 [Burkholderiales bacterium GWF1_66_17]HAX23080.1 hypothetical protein [Hydrogenophaga sp.]HBU17056.1 hypothetical protein [Hydrogenophaga sp.]
MDFKTYFTGLPIAERESFAQQAGTSRGYCNQVAYANKQIELGMADVFVAVSGGILDLDNLPLTDRAAAQRIIRERVAEPAPAGITAEASPVEQGA